MTMLDFETVFSAADSYNITNSVYRGWVVAVCVKPKAGCTYPPSEHSLHSAVRASSSQHKQPQCSLALHTILLMPLSDTRGPTVHSSGLTGLPKSYL